MINNRAKEFELSPVGPAAKWFIALIAIMPLIVALTLWLKDPVSLTALPVWGFLLIAGAGPVLIALSLSGVRNPKALLGPDGLKIRVSFVNKIWPLSSLDSKAAHTVNLDLEDGLKPRWKLFGAAMPGLKSGLFKLKNGARAHIYVTDTQKVVYIPSDKGVILLSMQSPASFLEHLQKLKC